MCECELRRVEGVTRDFVHAPAIEIVAEQGMSQMGEMDANLMSASRLKAKAQEAVSAVCPFCSVMCACGLPIGGDTAQDDARQGACDWCVYYALSGGQPPFDESKIRTYQCVLLCDLILYLGAFCNEEQPCRIAVKSVTWMKVEPFAA